MLVLLSLVQQLVLGYTTLYFVLVLVVLGYAGPAGLPTPSIPVWGQEWPAYIFTLTGILVVMSAGLFVACLRCRTQPTLELAATVTLDEDRRVIDSGGDLPAT